MYVIDYLDKSFFYNQNIPIISGKIRNTSLINLFTDSAHTNGWVNLSNLFDKEYILYPTHCCTPLTKTLMKNVEKEYYEHWDNTRKDRFRSKNGIPPIGMCINYNIPLNNINSPDKSYFYYTTNIYNFKANYLNKKLVCVNNLKEETEYEILKEVFFNNILYI